MNSCDLPLPFCRCVCLVGVGADLNQKGWLHYPWLGFQPRSRRLDCAIRSSQHAKLPVPPMIGCLQFWDESCQALDGERLVEGLNAVPILVPMTDGYGVSDGWRRCFKRIWHACRLSRAKPTSVREVGRGGPDALHVYLPAYRDGCLWGVTVRTAHAARLGKTKTKKHMVLVNREGERACGTRTRTYTYA